MILSLQNHVLNDLYYHNFNGTCFFNINTEKNIFVNFHFNCYFYDAHEYMDWLE
jgi:hypothetical protein